MAFGLALPVGWESVAEYLDIRLEGGVAADELKSRLGGALPRGLTILESGPVRKDHRSLSELAEVADYLVWVGDSAALGVPESAGWEESEPDLWSSIEKALDADELLAVRDRRGERVVEDIRPMIMDIRRFDATEHEPGPSSAAGLNEAFILEMRLRTKPYVLRPEVALTALGGSGHWRPLLVRRTAQYRLEGGELSSIDTTIDSEGFTS